MKKYFSKPIIIKTLLALFVVWMVIVLSPIFSLLSPSFLTKTHLVLITNEAETRPCGGFVSAYGLVRAFPPKVHLFNVYNLDTKDFGDAPEPLNQVASKLKFWDLGTSTNTEFCVDDFKYSYSALSKNKINSVILVPFKALESTIEILGPITVEDKKLTPQNTFGVLSRTVANTNRHDEESLENRKGILSPLVKQIFKKAVFSPHKWYQLTTNTKTLIKNGDIYVSGKSPKQENLADSFMLTEWNLGGAKTSRILEKQLDINIRETTPNQWEINTIVHVFHPGGIDEPLSQEWKGVMEIQAPFFISTQKKRESFTLQPGGHHTFGHTYGYNGNLSEIYLARPRTQKVFTRVSVSLFPQQYIESSDFITTESIGTWQDFAPFVPQKLSWQAHTDTEEPFLTLYEPISKDSLSPSVRNIFKDNNLLIEIHINEPSKIENLQAILKDNNIINTETENLPSNQYYIYPNKNVVILGFNQKQEQHEERFTLSLVGIEDLFGNTFSNQVYTVITRY